MAQTHGRYAGLPTPPQIPSCWRLRSRPLGVTPHVAHSLPTTQLLFGRGPSPCCTLTYFCSTATLGSLNPARKVSSRHS
ncbi:hypothetical protein BJX62DRAFT_220868 [Aspergillus germanicus]